MAWSKEKFATAAGTTILDSENTVKIEINDSEYIYKKARDVNPGDMVEFKKDFLDKSLGELEEVILEIEPRYRYAKEQLHEINNRREYIPKLRTLLIRGIKDESLENKILKQGDDFSKQEYDKMESEVVSVILNNEMTPLSAGHKNWLEGNTVAPCLENWNYFRALENINPEFTEWNSDNESLTGMYMSYRFYNAARRGVKAHLARCKGEGIGHQEENGEDDNGDRNNHKVIDLRPMLKELAEHFFKDINRQNIYVRVLERSHLHKKNQQSQAEEEIDTNLTKGIVIYKNGDNGTNNETNSGGDEGGKPKDLMELMEEETILNGYMQTIIKEMKYSDENGHNIPEEERRTMYAWNLPFLLEWFGELDPHTKYLKKIFETDLRKGGSMNINLERMKKVILSGYCDSFWNLKKGTTYNLLKTIYKVRTAMPSTVLEYCTFCKDNLLSISKKYAQMGYDIEGERSAVLSKIEPLISKGIFPDKILKENYRQIMKRQKELKDEFGVKIDIFGYLDSNKYFFTECYSPKDEIRNKEAAYKVKNNKDKLEELKQKTNPDIQFLKKDYVAEVIKKYGFESMLNIRKEDFYWEEKPSILSTYVNKIGNLFKKKDFRK